MKILIADDDIVARRMLEATLVRLGHEVIAVESGTEAMERLLSQDGPRLAILDWMMPGADGLTVCRAVRQKETSYVYLILLTARNGPGDMLEAVDAEVDDFLTKPFNLIELRGRLRTGARVLELQERLQRLATLDALTEVPNRRRVLEQLATDLARAARSREPLTVALLDLDKFKSVNDLHGHATGDALLKHAASRIRSVLRPHDTLGRYGGEEFLLVLPNCGEADAREVADRVRLAIAGEPVALDGGLLPMTASLGIATTLDGRESASDLILRADRALYRAKANGRNCVAA